MSYTFAMKKSDPLFHQTVRDPEMSYTFSEKKYLFCMLLTLCRDDRTDTQPPSALKLKPDPQNQGTG